MAKTPLLSLARSQARHVSKPLWLLQLAAVLATWLFSKGFADMRQVQSFIFIVVPILAFYTAPEFVKSRIYGMGELEMACKNSPAKIAAVKLLLIGTANIAAIAAIALILRSRYQADFATLLAYGFMPFNVINCATLSAMEIFKIKTSYALLSVSLIASLVFVFGSDAAPLLQNAVTGCSLGSAALLAMLLAFSIKRTSGRRDILIWN
ncbi:MAG: hypothetical protein LBL83_11545 [Clostridiales bacterium]|nr:hypothetical protein [Clostridiales bacterium]